MSKYHFRSKDRLPCPLRPRHGSLARLIVTASVVTMAHAGGAFAQQQPVPASTAVPPIPTSSVAQAPTEGQGVPFPSSLRQSGSTVQLPVSTQPMALDNTRINETMKRSDDQVDHRLENLRVGQGNLASPNVAAYQSELTQLSEEQRQIRLLQAKQARADLAVKLWSTLYDPRRENDISKPDAKVTAAGSAATASTPAPATPLAVQVPQSNPAKQDQVPVPVAAAIEPWPKIVVINSRPSGDGLRATLLVPQVGEVKASQGTVLPGGRRVSRISSDGVMVYDPRLGMTVPLGYGDSVPLVVSTPQSAARTPGTPGMPEPAGFPVPVSAPR